MGGREGRVGGFVFGVPLGLLFTIQSSATGGVGV